jgi:hypothetical protein
MYSLFIDQVEENRLTSSISMETAMTSKGNITVNDGEQLEAPVTLNLDQIEEAAGGAAVVGAALLKVCPPVTMGIINPDIFETMAFGGQAL